jgi:hypothetical protein
VRLPTVASRWPRREQLSKSAERPRSRESLFFDFFHGQDGVAPNAIELHPILSFRCLVSAVAVTAVARHKTPKKGSGSSSQRCDPSYVGACLKLNVSDYDCAGGSGNGPYYTGPVRVVGPDHYHLDADGDGYACEDS